MISGHGNINQRRSTSFVQKKVLSYSKKKEPMSAKLVDEAHGRQHSYRT